MLPTNVPVTCSYIEVQSKRSINDEQNVIRTSTMAVSGPCRLSALRVQVKWVPRRFHCLQLSPTSTLLRQRSSTLGVMSLFADVRRALSILWVYEYP